MIVLCRSEGWPCAKNLSISTKWLTERVPTTALRLEVAFYKQLEIHVMRLSLVPCEAKAAPLHFDAGEAGIDDDHLC